MHDEVTGTEFVVLLVVLAAFLVTTLEAFTVAYRQTGLCDSSGIEHRDPATCFYFATTTWTTIGLGDITPTTAARPIVTAEAIVAYGMTGILLAVLVRLVTIFRL